MNSYSILVVEDEKEIADAIEIYLLNQGYEVYKAYNGLEGLKVIEKNEIHLAIVDIMMPVMDGVTMIMKLREKHDFPVIILSAKSSAGPFLAYSVTGNPCILVSALTAFNHFSFKEILP